jgi:hypothetical protein
MLKYWLALAMWIHRELSMVQFRSSPPKSYTLNLSPSTSQSNCFLKKRCTKKCTGFCGLTLWNKIYSKSAFHTQKL